MKDDDAWEVGDPQLEWAGRADGMTDGQLSFSDLEELVEDEPS